MVCLPELGIFNVRADVDACDRTQGCTDTVRESALEADSASKKSLAAPGTRTRASLAPGISV